MHDFFFFTLFAKGRGGDKDVIFGLQNKTKISRCCFIFMLFFFGSLGWGIQFNFQRNLKLITQDNYCMTRSAAMKYNPQVNVNNCV